MDSHDHQTDEEKERWNSNTEYMLTKCRITKPAPPKPATNPLQFIKLSPCPLFQKAQEQIKKVEKIKKEEKEIGTEIEDWQTNLDNWKSSRRKRQEHIIERVVEVKKLTEQDDHEKGRRKSKTFTEMLEGRNKDRPKFNIPIYEDDSNDLSDYGISSSSSKANSIKDPDTDNSLLDEKDDTSKHIFDIPSNKETFCTANQSHSEEETNTKNGTKISNDNNNLITNTFTSVYNANLRLSKHKHEISDKTSLFEVKDTKQYTYEGAIEDYRSRVQSINSEDFNRNKDTEPLLPKGEIFKRKDLYEKQNSEMSQLSSSKNLSEFVNIISIKDRLKMFEQSSNQMTKIDAKSDMPVYDMTKLQNKTNVPYNTNNMNKTNINKITNYTIEKSISEKFEKNIDNRSFSPETEMYINKLNMFNRDLDNLMMNKSIDEHYTPSLSSTELTCASSDREDSGIHTGDISCSVSQADESTDIDVEITPTLNNNHDNKDIQLQSELDKVEESNHGIEEDKTNINTLETLQEIVDKKESENQIQPMNKPKPVIYENVDIKSCVPPVEIVTSDFVPFSDFNAPLKEPPKVKPPPPPPTREDEKAISDLAKFANIRSSFFNSDMSKSTVPSEKMYLNTEGFLNKVESQDSGLDVDRGRLSSDTWCSSVGDSSAISHEKQPSELTTSNISEEDEIAKKEREIIEMVEKEEQYRDIVECKNKEPLNQELNSLKKQSFEPTLGSEQFDNPCLNTQSYDLLEPDSEVLKVEQELRQLELEELERQRENSLFQKRARAHLQHNRHSLESLTDRMYPSAMYDNYIDSRKSLPELPKPKSSTLDYEQSLPGHSYYGYENVQDLKYGYKKSPLQVENALGIPYNHRKSLPNLQHSQKKNSPERYRPMNDSTSIPKEHRKSMPELLIDVRSEYKPMNKKPAVIPAKPPILKERSHYEQHNIKSPTRQMSAIQSKLINENRNYNEHWLIQEAELRRINCQRKPPNNSGRPQPIHRKQQPLPINYQPESYAMPSTSYSPPVVPKDPHDKILSVSGKKRCSYCGNELGRGAAMIVESLSLFYHMDCFKCCVCHVQLGNGMMGTDVKVRNQKLHCHNCYSSDDGIKFSCV